MTSIAAAAMEEFQISTVFEADHRLNSVLVLAAAPEAKYGPNLTHCWPCTTILSATLSQRLGTREKQKIA